jgi:uncharacterized protein DUF4349
MRTEERAVDDGDEGSIGWRRPLAVLAVVTMLCAVGIAVVGTQAGMILSTVGSSVGPGSGIVTPGGGQDSSADQGAAGGSGGGGGHAPGVGSDGSVSPNMLDASRPDLLVIKSGDISIQAASIGTAVQKVTDAITALGGYVSASSRSGTAADASASVTFRVPAARWEAALTAARGAGDALIDEQTRTDDVTGDVVDLEARIRNLQATETAVEAIMAKAGTIDDVLTVESQLSDVRGDIEQLTAKAADLRGRAAYSTLIVHVGVKPTPVARNPKPAFDPAQEADAATSRLVRILQRVATVGIWVAIVWLPIVGALALVGGIGFLVARRFRRAFGGGVAGPGDAGSLLEGGT